MGRWVLVTVLLVVAILIAFGIFVATGVIDGPALFWRLGLKIDLLQPHLETYSHGQNAELWIANQEQELETKLAELEKREEELTIRFDQLEQKTQQLDKRETDLNKQIDSFQAQQAQHYNVSKLAELYTEMTPEESSRILEKLEQSLILEILLLMDMRDAANILTKLPTNLAVTLSKQLGEASK